MPRVLVLTPDFPPATGGIQTLMHRIVRHAGALEVRVVTRGHPGARSFDAGGGLDVRRSGEAGGGPLSNLLLNVRALAEAASFRPEAVLSGHIVTSPAARCIGAAMRVPVIQYLHADELGMRPRLAAFAARTATAVVAVSGYTRGLALALGAQPARVHTIPNGVDLPDGPAASRASRPTVVTVARLEERYKGHDVLMRALPLVRARVPGVRWVVVGDGSLRPELERLAVVHDLLDVVRFAGQVSDAERDALLDSSHVFAMPSRLRPDGGGEGFGIVYLEAGAHRLPVVAGNVAGALDSVVDGETGLLVDPTDHTAVAYAVSELLLNPARAEALGRGGAERAAQFAWPAISRRVEELVLALAAR
jgi:phosphatidylinositol alpha-1,6-mannosyltransferase